MGFWNSVLKVCNGLSTVIGDVEQATLMTAARSEPNPIVRQQKIQMVLQLPTITNSFVRGQMITEIIHKST
jgi:hypothetical protein